MIIRALEQALLFVLALFMPKSRRVWIISCKNGISDGSAALAQELSSQHPEIKIVWLLNKGQYFEPEQCGFEATFISYEELKKYWYILRAGVAVYSYGFNEVGGLGCHRAYVVNLWHGTPLKYIYGDELGNSRLDKIKKRLMSNFINLIPVSSVRSQERMARAFFKKNDRVPVLGEPRTDFLFSTEKNKKDIRENILLANKNIESDVRSIILWAPTWRDGRPGLPSIDKKVILEIDAMLRKHKAALFIRPHPHEVAHIPSLVFGKNIGYMYAEDFPDANKTLDAFDALITDYSSISIDYSLLNKPIIFFAHDAEEYNNYRGMYESFEEFTGGNYIKDISLLPLELSHIMSCGFKKNEASEVIRNKYHTYLDGASSERVIEHIMEEIC